MAQNQKPTFSLNEGYVFTNFPYIGFNSASSVSDIKILENGKILLGGSDGYSSTLARYNNNGLLDSVFGSSGYFIANSNEFEPFYFPSSSTINLQVDGKVLVASYQGGIARFNQDGTVDTTFGENGKLLTNSMNVQSLLIQGDGKILVAGGIGIGPNMTANNVTRYNIDGTLDTSFGVNGTTQTRIGFEDIAYDAALQPDGKIIIVGRTFYDTATRDFSIVRYNSDGSLDTTFSEDGKQTTAIGNMDDHAYSIKLQADGKLVVGGISDFDLTLVRYNSNGSLDSSFSNDGIVKMDLGGTESIESLIIQSDGKILVSGNSYNVDNKQNIFLARFNGDGSVDKSFANDGFLITNFGTNYSSVSDIDVQPDGRIVLAGRSDKEIVLVRYNSNGSIDSTFNDSDNENASTLNNSLVIYEENNFSPTLLDTSVALYDADLAKLNNGIGNYNQSSITLSRQGGANSDDIFFASGNLSFVGSRAVLSGIHVGTVTNQSGKLEVDFNENATQSRVNEVLSSICYSNISNTPPSTIYIDWTFNDGNTGSQGSGGSLSITNSVLVTIIPINDAPKLLSSIPDQYTAVGNPYNYSIAKNSFIDVDGDKLTYKATLINGFSLPDWLKFDPVTQTFSGTPNSSGKYEIRVMAEDTAQTVVSDYFVLNIAAKSSSTEDNILIAGSTKDTLKGGLGDDRYILNISMTGQYEGKVLELKGQGNDTLVYRNEVLTAQTKAVTLKLLTNFENLDISATGSMNFNLTGNSGDNILTANAGNNLIDGGKGADTMIGGAGNDTYILDNGGDTVLEAYGEGADQVNIKLASNSIYDSYSLDPNIENAVLTNKVAFNLEGNELSNYLKGNSAANWIYGNAGNDTIDASKGKDTLQGGMGNDVLLGGAGADTFVWTLADAGTVGAAAVDTIQDFSVKQKDVLDLRDLLPPNAVESDVGGLLTNFIDIRLEAANTVIGINTDGNLNSGENQQIVLANVNLFALTKATDETALLNNLIMKNQFLFD